MILSLRQIYFTLLLYINEDTIHVEFKDISRSAGVWDQLADTHWLLCYWMTKDILNLNLVKQTCKVSGKHLWLMDYVTAPQISIRPRYFEFIVKICSILIFTYPPLKNSYFFSVSWSFSLECPSLSVCASVTCHQFYLCCLCDNRLSHLLLSDFLQFVRK